MTMRTTVNASVYCSANSDRRCLVQMGLFAEDFFIQNTNCLEINDKSGINKQNVPTINSEDIVY